MNINYAKDVQGSLSEYDEIEIIEKVLQGYDMTPAEPVNVIIKGEESRRVKVINGMGEEVYVDFPSWANYYCGGMFFKSMEEFESRMMGDDQGLIGRSDPDFD